MIPHSPSKLQTSNPQFSLFVMLLAATVTLTPIMAPAGSFAQSDHPAKAHDVKPGATLTGKATIYPNVLNGHETSNGETFHQVDHTAASNRLPLGTDVKVTNLKNGKSTHVTVNDRGPALGSRKIDLSKKAANEIGLSHKEGKVPVAIKVLRTPDAR